MVDDDEGGEDGVGDIDNGTGADVIVGNETNKMTMKRRDLLNSQRDKTY